MIGFDETPPDAPEWYKAAKAKQEARIQALAKNAAPLEYTIPDVAPGYHEVEMRLTCIPNETYPWDPGVMKAVQQIRPDLTPLWIDWVFLTPVENGARTIQVFGRHGLGRISDTQQEGFVTHMPNMPCQGIRFNRPNRLWIIFEGEKNKYYPDLPGAYVPFSWNVFEYVRNCPDLSTKDIKKRFVDDKRDAAERKKQQMLDERAYVQRDIDKYVQKKLDSVSESEMRDHFMGSGNKGPKPMIVVGKHG